MKIKIKSCFVLNTIAIIGLSCLTIILSLKNRNNNIWWDVLFLLVFCLIGLVSCTLLYYHTYHSIQNENKPEIIQSEFIANVTHELKTPLTSIKGFVETLKGGAYKDSVTAEKFLEIIDIEAERLCSLINDILLLSELESGFPDINRQEYRLEEIVEEVISILSSNAEKRGISISYNIQKDLMILVNKDRIKQMLINLIDNAIKYNVEEGIVEVTALKDNKNVIITIKDSGIGMEKKNASAIFERFYRVDKGRSRGMGGTGLGLSIVKNIVDQYKGNITTNTSIGEGTEFIITLPI